MITYQISEENRKILKDWHLNEFANADSFCDEQLNRLRVLSDLVKHLTELVLTNIPASKQRNIAVFQCRSILFLCASSVLSVETNKKRGNR